MSDHETYAVNVWYTDEQQLTIDAESPEAALEKAEEQFRMIESGEPDSFTLYGTVEGNAVHPLDNGDGYVRREK